MSLIAIDGAVSVPRAFSFIDLCASPNQKAVAIADRCPHAVARAAASAMSLNGGRS